MYDADRFYRKGEDLFQKMLDSRLMLKRHQF